MTEYIVTKKDNIIDIADAIRLKLGTNELLSLTEMAAAIDRIPLRHVIGKPVEFTLPASSWNGTSYTLVANNYKIGANGVQVGLPSNISTVKAQAAIAAALTIVSTTSTSTSVTLTLSAVNAPTTDITIAIFGLEALS